LEIAIRKTEKEMGEKKKLRWISANLGKGISGTVQDRVQ
jgi:hypothetical protein